MPNTIATNSLAELVTLRFAESAGYFTTGSRKYFAGQLEGKRNGEVYRFVIRDTGEAVNSLTISAGDKTSIVEREVSLKLDPWHVGVKTNSIESVTSLKWDDDIAKPNSQKLVNSSVRKVVESDLGKCGTAFVGSGFLPLARASGHLSSITSEKLYGFISPQIESTLTSNGQQFVPVGAPPMYKTGLLGEFHGAEYRAQRFIKNVNISADMVTGLTGATLASSSAYTANSNGTATLALSFSSASTGFTIPRGAVIWVNGAYACDCVGDVTAELHAFVVLADVAVASSATAANVVVQGVDMTANAGTRDIAKADGSAFASTDFNSAKVAIPDAGMYFGGYVRAEGSFEFETLDKLDAEGADYEKASINGVTIHKNKLVNLETMENTTRFDIVTLAGVVEPRAVAYVLVK